MNDLYIMGDVLVKYKGFDETVNIPEGVRTIGRQAFCFKTNVKRVILPETLETIGDSAFESCSALEEIIIPNSVKSIGKGVFVGCTELKTVFLPSQLDFLPSRTFVNCRSLENVSVPETIDSIGERAFAGCRRIKSVTVPEKCKNVGDCAFIGCSELKRVIIKAGLTQIGWNTFAGCSALTQIEIASRLFIIAVGAFDACESLTDIYYTGDESEWRKVNINYINNAPLKTLTVHYESKIRDNEDKTDSKIDETAEETKASEETDTTVSENKEKTSDSDALKTDNNTVNEVKPQVKATVKKVKRTKNAPARVSVASGDGEFTAPTKEEFYKSFIELIPNDVKNEQMKRKEELTDELFDVLSEGLFLIPGKEAYEFGCLCLLVEKYNWAFRAFLSAAGKGSHLSQYYIGCCFMWGIDTTRKLADASRWLEKCKNAPECSEQAEKAIAMLNAELDKPENANVRINRRK